MKITDTIKVGPYTLQSRIVMPPMATGFGRGLVDKTLAYYKDRAATGAIGMIITEHSYISEVGRAEAEQVSVARDSDIEALKKLAAAVQVNGTVGLVQINHGGSANEAALDAQAIAPSAVPNRRPDIVRRYKDKTPILPHEMTQDDINTVKDQFVAAALRVKAAGFAGVEIHSAHSYLLSEFYSPLMNHRTDAYTGAAIEGRTQLQTEILEAVRKAVGGDFIVSIRLGAVDDMPGGAVIDDVGAAARRFEAAGADLISISGGANGFTRPGNTQEGWYRDVSHAAKEAVSIPVLVTGGIKTRAAAEDILNAGDADLIGIGRMLLAKANYAADLINE